MYMTSESIRILERSLPRDLWAFLPETILCVGIVLLLVLRLFNSFGKIHMGRIALVITVLAIGATFVQGVEEISKSTKQNMFTGLLVYDGLTIYMRMFLLTFAALVIVLTLLTGIPDKEDSADFYCLLLGATLGMSIMSSANHLLMVFIGVEMASLPSYALAGFLKGKRRGSEASLKYVVYGGGASGIMLYGISLLAGRFGTGYLPAVAAKYMALFPMGGVYGHTPIDLMLLLGTLFLLIGIAFKLAAVPFHFWCPDVFEGAAAEVAGFLSVASKGAALVLLARITLVFTGMDKSVLLPQGHGMDVARVLIPILAVMAAVTATFGNLAAYFQTNMKRLLAYSTIAHAGYMMMGLTTLTQDGVSAVLFYLIAYLVMNLGAFGVVAFIRNLTGSEDLNSYRGLVQRSPILVVALSIFLLSLLGIPPLAGFAGKYQVFSALYDAGLLYYRTGQDTLGFILFALLVIGGLNTVLSAFYYLRVMKYAIIEPPLEQVEGRPVAPLTSSGGSLAYAIFLTLMIFGVFFLWDPLGYAGSQGVNRFGMSHSQTAFAQEGGAKP